MSWILTEIAWELSTPVEALEEVLEASEEVARKKYTQRQRDRIEYLWRRAGGEHYGAVREIE